MENWDGNISQPLYLSQKKEYTYTYYRIWGYEYVRTYLLLLL